MDRADQAEVDHFWDELTVDDGKEGCATDSRIRSPCHAWTSRQCYRNVCPARNPRVSDRSWKRYFGSRRSTSRRLRKRMPAASDETLIPTEELAAPARRTLSEAGYTMRERLDERGETSNVALHGVGLYALETPRAALDA